MKLKEVKKGLKYSIIIVTYNVINDLSVCVQSIFRHTKDFEIIIVDNGSVDGSSAYVQYLNDKYDNVKCILNKENVNFGPGNNQGLEIAEGERIILLNSDTIVTPMWAESMDHCLAHKENIAMVGPVSNSSNGRQYVQPTEDVKNSNAEQFSVDWANRNKGVYLSAGILYGWCMMINRDFLTNQDYLFDDRFTNSYEDNDLCVRATYLGWNMYIDYSTFIFHKGQSTFHSLWKKEFMDKYEENGKKNQKLFLDKWKPKKNQKLIAIYRIANCEKYLAKSLDQTSKFADEIICLFARSQDRTKEIALSYPKVKVWEEWDCPFDEQKERNWLLQKAIDRGADWVISIDGDEIYEDKFVENVRNYMEVPNPHVLGYWCNWRTIWDVVNGVEKFRADSTFGQFQNYRFFRVLPKMRINENDNIYNHHCGSAPHLPVENLAWLNVRVKHLGYDTPEQRKLKHEFYLKNDPRPVLKDVGTEDYHHLIDTKVELKTYRENNRLTIMTVCLNEEKMIYNMLSNVAIVADEYVILDTGSTDGTLKEIERFAKYSNIPVKVVQKEFEKDEEGFIRNFSEVKNYAKSLCTTEWILNMDCDEFFNPGEVCSIFALIDEDVDGILFNVINYMEAPKGRDYRKEKYSLSETIRLYRNIDELFYSGFVHESLEDSINTRIRNKRGSIVLSPFVIHHKGYLKTKERVNQKTKHYHRLNLKQFEVSGGKDPRPLFNMAMHYANIGDEKKTLECYQASLKLDKDFWRSKQNMAYYYLDKAKSSLNEMREKNQPPQYLRTKPMEDLMTTLNGLEFKAHKVG